MGQAAEVRVPRPVRLDIAGEALNADLILPPDPSGLVLFAHGSGSSRHSARNRNVADVLQQDGLATLLLDLLTEQEELTDVRTAEFRFDIPLLADRLVGAIDWAEAHPELASLRADRARLRRSSPRRAGRARSARSSHAGGVRISPSGRSTPWLPRRSSSSADA